MFGVTDKLYTPGCVLVLIYDESMPVEIADSLIPNLQNSDRTLLVLDLRRNNVTVVDYYHQTWSVEQVLLIANYLHKLYHVNRCYIFLIWINDLRVLYPPDINIHPGWRNQDIVIFPSHHLGREYNNGLIQMRFWAAIPNIIGIRRQHPTRHNCKRIMIFTVAPYGDRSGPLLKELDTWLVLETKFERNAPLLWDKFSSFNNTPLKLAILWKPPYYIFGDAANPFVDGIDWRLLQLVYKNLHFQFNINTTESTAFSGCHHKGNWSGAMGFLQWGRADLAVGGLSKTGQRLADFDFTMSYSADAYVFISPITTANPIVMDIFGKPLDPEVWQILLLSCVGVAVALKYLAKLERNISKERKANCGRANEVKHYRDTHFTSFWHNVYFLYNTFCQKPFPHIPFSNAIKLGFIGTSLSITILGIIFAGSLFSQLFHSRKDISINTYDEILESKLPVCVMNYDGILNYGVKKAKRISLKQIWGNATFADYFNSTTCIENVIRGKGIYIDTYSKLHFIGSHRHLGTNGIKFHFGKERLFYQTNIGWAARKRWPFLPKISQILSRAVESGLVNHWMSIFKRGKFGWDQESINILRDLNWTLPAPTQDETKNLDPTKYLGWDERFVRLGFLQFGTVYRMWVQGMILASFAFIGELLMHGTWTTVSVLKLVIRRIVQLFRIKRLEKELLPFEKIIDKSLSSAKKTGKNQKKKPSRRQPEVIRYFMWTDLEGGTTNEAHHDHTIKRIFRRGK